MAFPESLVKNLSKPSKSRKNSLFIYEQIFPGMMVVVVRL
jgi:hypothetical protein